MVVGFDKFREAFRAYSDSYIVIGGSACDWLMSYESVPFRATKDIEGARLVLPQPVRNDFEEFLEVYVKHPTDPAPLNVPGTFEEAIAHIRRVFC